MAWDWRNATATRLEPDATIPFSLNREDWTFHVLAPILSSGLAVIGDVSKFVTAGDARHRGVRDVRLASVSSSRDPGETVTVTGWAEVIPTSPDATVAYDSYDSSVDCRY